MLKIISIFSLVRGYNIGLVVLAQYLTSIFILAHETPMIEVLFDPSLLVLVISTVGAIASGYIINNFYDLEKDLINRPQKSILDHLISQKTKLSLYFVINILVLLFSSLISLRAGLFFAGYMFFIWLYSHKIKKQPVLGNLTSALLSITPFFAILLYFKNYNLLIFVFGFYLFLILAIRELAKDLENIKGDLTLNYKTVPVVYGEKATKLMMSILIALNCLVSLLLVFYFELRLMYSFFIGSTVYLILLLFMIWNAQRHQDYNRIHNFLKLLILAGVFSILLLDPALILNKIF
ncbi:MAG: geranylgeranylglycerol-phosphate geranylgeranyltransferase [Flavobacteriaceae bacterium]